MESKLKALKVADLREILQKASVPIPAKSNKADLIAKILATPAALDAYNNQNGASKLKEPEAANPDDDLLAPPEDFDWDPAATAGSSTTTSKPAPAPAKTEPVKPPSPVKAASAPETKDAAPAAEPTEAAKPAATTAAEDEELEKRRKRAARFNIPLVEPKAKPVPKATGNGAAKVAKNGKAALSPEEQAKLETRAAKFGLAKETPAAAAAAAASTPAAATVTPTTPAATNPQKRKQAPAAEVDPEELERRKRRAERFAGGGEKKTA